MGMATPPRIVTPGRPVFLTIRAVNRQFRFVPSKEIVDSIRFVFWHCVSAYNISVHEALWMSNHAHICLTDNDGVLPRFVCKMNSMLSRQLNALRGHKGTNIEKGYSDIEICHDQSMASLCAYALANPCAAHLVNQANAWQGFTTHDLEYNQSFVVERPNCGLWGDGNQPRELIPKTFRPKLKPNNATNSSSRRKPSTLPQRVEGVLTRPKIHLELSDAALRASIRLETKLREQKAQEKRNDEGRSVIGMARVLRRKWNESPSTFEPLFEEIQRIATRCITQKIEKARLLARFNQEYEDALRDFIEKGKSGAVFPPGTWKMRTLFRANCAEIL